MRVIQNEKFSVYVYPDDHPPPHCHIRYKDDSSVVVTIPLMVPLYGGTISKEAKKVVKENLNELSKVWEKLNRHVKSKPQKK